MIKISELAAALQSGNRRALGRAITLVESTLPSHRELANELMALLPTEGEPSIRIGISGSPGVGKSTFIETLGEKVIAGGKKLAVLAIDPSSPLSDGSILGDKTRMNRLAVNPHAFIRPSPAKQTLGGVGRKTRETISLCEAAGFDAVIVETVGVGQSEYMVRSMVDIFVFMQLPNAGDDLQGIKKGILELADIIAINKADGDQQKAAKRAQVDLELALNLIYQIRPGDKPQTVLVSALTDQGVAEFYQLIEQIFTERCQSGQLKNHRNGQDLEWFDSEVKDLLMAKIIADGPYQNHYHAMVKTIVEGQSRPLAAALKFVEPIKIERSENV